MGRPSKLTAEQQIQAIAKLKSKRPRAEICAEFGISELTLYRYLSMAKMAEEIKYEFAAGQKAEQRMAAQEVAQEMAPPEAA